MKKRIKKKKDKKKRKRRKEGSREQSAKFSGEESAKEEYPTNPRLKEMNSEERRNEIAKWNQD